MRYHRYFGDLDNRREPKQPPWYGIIWPFLGMLLFALVIWGLSHAVVDSPTKQPIVPWRH